MLPTLRGNTEPGTLFSDVNSTGSTTPGLVAHPHHAFGTGVDVVDGRSDDVGSSRDGLARRLIDVDCGMLFILVRITHDGRGRATGQDRKQNSQKNRNDRFHDNLLQK